MKSDLVYNEQVKALASMCHNLAVASITSAVLVPLVVANTVSEPTFGYFVTVPVGFGLATLLASVGQMMLKDLRG